MAGDFSPAHPVPMRLGAADPIDRWGQHTLAGNLAFEHGEDFKARQSYAEALVVAEEMMLLATISHDARLGRLAPALYGIACNNIIALARRQDDGLTAGIFLCKVASGFLSVMESNEAPLSLRSRCLLHSRVASSALCSYFEERGMWDAAETYTARANAAFFVVDRLRSELPTAAPFAAADGASVEADPLAIEAATLALEPAPAGTSSDEANADADADSDAVEAALAPSLVDPDAIAVEADAAALEAALSGELAAGLEAAELASPAPDAPVTPPARPTATASPLPATTASATASPLPLTPPSFTPPSFAPPSFTPPSLTPPSLTPPSSAPPSFAPPLLTAPFTPGASPAPVNGGPPPLPAWVTAPPGEQWLTDPVWVPMPATAPEPPRSLGVRFLQWVSRGFRRPSRPSRASLPSMGDVARAK